MKRRKGEKMPHGWGADKDGRVCFSFALSSRLLLLELEVGRGRAARGPARAGPGLKIQARGPYGPKRA